MTRAISVEPPWFGMTGVCSYTNFRRDCDFADVQPLDAPEYIARGSLQAGHTKDDGTVYVSTTFAEWSRIRFKVQS
jgi:hypothetical protein